jgi:hypothetical protein
MLARDSNTSKSTTRNAVARAVAIGLLEKTERRFCCAVLLPNILTYGKPDKRAAQIAPDIGTVVGTLAARYSYSSPETSFQ